MIGLKDSRQFFSHWEAKPKPMAPCARDFSRALSKLQIIVRNCDWFIALFAPVVIGRSNCFGFGFSTGIWKPLYMLEWNKYCSLSDAPKPLVNHLHLAALTLKWSILSTAMLHDENMEKRSHSDSPEIFSFQLVSPLFYDVVNVTEVSKACRKNILSSIILFQVPHPQVVMSMSFDSSFR